MIINLGCASVDNHIPRDDIFDYHPLRECNIYIITASYRDKIVKQSCYFAQVCSWKFNKKHMGVTLFSLQLSVRE